MATPNSVAGMRLSSWQVRKRAAPDSTARAITRRAILSLSLPSCTLLREDRTVGYDESWIPFKYQKLRDTYSLQCQSLPIYHRLLRLTASDLLRFSVTSIRTSQGVGLLEPSMEAAVIYRNRFHPGGDQEAVS